MTFEMLMSDNLLGDVAVCCLLIAFTLSVFHFIKYLNARADRGFMAFFVTVWILEGAALFLTDFLYRSSVTAESSFTALRNFLCDVPLWCVLLLYLFFLAFSVFNTVHTRVIRKRVPSVSAVKESIDSLPVGICFADHYGRVRFQNQIMNSISERLNVKPLSSINDFFIELSKVCEKTGRPGEYLFNCDGRSYLISNRAVNVNRRKYMEVYAVDMTFENKITMELKVKNRKLVEIQERMREYSAQVNDVITSREILNAKMAVHDEVGHALLTTKYYVEHPDRMDEEALLDILKRTNAFLLKEAESDDSGTIDVFENAVRNAEEIGVSCIIEGSVPQEDSVRAVIARGIVECASNTAKHAGGDKLFAEIRSREGVYEIVFRNNGKAPDKEVVETGGLKSYKYMILQSGGKMKISYDPEFELFVSIPSKR